MLILGIDQSYTRTGIALIEGTCKEDAEIIKVRSIEFRGAKGVKTLKRNHLRLMVEEIVQKYAPDCIICERVRQFSKGFISMDFVKSQGALIATLVDAVYPVPVFSADTRSWKAKVIGSSKGGKEVSSEYILQRYERKLNDDAADAVCIAIYGLTAPQLLKQEK